MGIPNNGWFLRENHLKIRMRRPEPSSFHHSGTWKDHDIVVRTSESKWAIWVLNFSREKD